MGSGRVTLGRPASRVPRAPAGGDRKFRRPVQPRGKVHVGRHDHGQPALVVGCFFAVHQPFAVGRGERPFHRGRPRLAGNRGGQEVIDARHADLQLSRSGDDQSQVPGRDRVQLPAMIEVAPQRDGDQRKGRQGDEPACPAGNGCRGNSEAGRGWCGFGRHGQIGSNARRREWQEGPGTMSGTMYPWSWSASPERGMFAARL